MAQTNMDGKPIRRVLEWLLNRDLTDADMAAALDVHPSNYSRHKDDDDYPSFEELTTLGGYFHVSPTMLQIAFGLLDTDALILLNEDEMKQYLEQGGGNHMRQSRVGATNGAGATTKQRLETQYFGTPPIDPARGGTNPRNPSTGA